MLEFVGGALIVPVLIVYLLVVVVALGGLLWLILRGGNDAPESATQPGRSAGFPPGD